MIRPAVARLLAAVAGGLLLAASGLVPAGADPLDDAARAAATLTFTADVTVRWVDERGRHETTMTVHGQSGHVRIDGPAAIATLAGQGRMISHATGGWEQLWSGGLVPESGPAATRKYSLELSPGPSLAGRSTRLVHLRVGGALRELLAVDEETGLIMQRQVLDTRGQQVRMVSVDRLTLDTDGQPRPPTPTQRDSARRVAPASLSAPYRLPAELAGSYVMVGAYRRGPMIHLLYSDGLHGLSVFAQRGRLDRGLLPGGGRPVPLGRFEGLAYLWPGGEALTWQAGPVVYTAVGDGAPEDVLLAVRSLPAPVRLSLAARLRSAARTMADLLHP